MGYGDTALDISRRYRSLLEAGDAAAAERLFAAYQRVILRLEAEVESLLSVVAVDGMTASRLRKLHRFSRLIAQAEDAYGEYGAVVKEELSRAISTAIELASKAAGETLTALTTEFGITGTFESLDPRAVEVLIGMLDEGSPLVSAIDEMAPMMATEIGETVVEMVAAGMNPRVIASELTKTFGTALTATLKTLRTVQNFAYRESARLNYEANDDILSGWWWNSALDDRTCMSCIAQHGSIHSLGESLNDHHNGRCAPIPIVKGYPPSIESGEDWFKKQTPQTQRAMMGPKKWQAWEKGQFTFGQLSTTYQDPILGAMQKEASLALLTSGPHP